MTQPDIKKLQSLLNEVQALLNREPQPAVTPWKLRITDAYCTWEFELGARNNDVSISMIYEMARRRLGADLEEGRQIK